MHAPFFSFLLAVILVSVNCFATPVFGQMSSTSYRIDSDTISVGGDDQSSSASYLLRDSVGGEGGGVLTSASYQLYAGYRAGIYDPVVLFDVETETDTEVSAEDFDGTDVTVEDSADFSIGDTVALIQNVGEDQVVAVAKITAIPDGETIQSTNWVDDGAAPVIDGTDDLLVLVGGTEIGFGTFSTEEVSTAVVGLTVSSDLLTGYRVLVHEDTDLLNGAVAITDVADGAVSVGDEEYGGRSSDQTISDSTFDTQDTAFTTENATVVEHADPVLEALHFVEVRAAIDVDTPEGDYAHILSFILVPNF